MMPQVFSVGDKYRMHTVQIYTRAIILQYV